MCGQDIEAPKDAKHHKNFNLEVFGAHFGTGVNFDMRFHKGRVDGLGFRVGIGGIPEGTIPLLYTRIRDFSLMSIPIEMNYVVGAKNHGLVAGLGILSSIIQTSGDFPNVNNNPIEREGLSYTGIYTLFGYRYSSLKKGLHIQLHYNPIFTSELGRIEYFGLQIGIGFK